MKYAFKIEIILDEEKIKKDGKYALDDVYYTILEAAQEQHLTRLKAENEKILLFGISGDGKDDLAYVTLFERCLLRSKWFRECVKSMNGYEENNGNLTKINLIKLYDNIMSRNGL